MNGSRRDCDVVVIGAGAAGIPAALFASASGDQRLVLIEAADRIGGTLHISSGQMSAADTRIQAAKKIKDSPAAHFADIMRINRHTGNPALIKLATENAADTLHWLLDNGLELLPDHPVIHFGHEPYSIPRTYWGPEEGRSILKVLAPLIETAVAEGRIDLHLSTRLVALVPQADGSIEVVVERAGKRSAFTAPVVILASGGFSANSQMFSTLSGGKPLYGGGYCFNQGGGLDAALAVGGVVVNEDDYLPTFAGVHDADAPGGVAFATQTYPQFRAPWEVYVDTYGDRFLREDEPSVDTRERALLALPDMRFWAIFDESVRLEAPSFFTVNDWRDVEPRFNRDRGYYRAGSLAQLAALIDANPAKLQRSVGAYNQAIADDTPDPFGRLHRPLPLAVPPFYAVEHLGWSIVGFAGLAVDDQLRVVTRSGDTIPGLFAAGEILGLGATSGNAFVGGMSVTPAMTFGRLLGMRVGKVAKRAVQSRHQSSNA